MSIPHPTHQPQTTRTSPGNTVIHYPLPKIQPRKMRFAVATALVFALVQLLIQGPSFAAAHCFEAREVAGNAQALKAEPYGRRSFIHCGKKHKDDDDYDDKDDGYGKN
ncbi:hypothetical protein PGT21_024965 [Puccinia graminis f. sp. tritici]|uniref:Uncharacterized protein n=1 Tax=Puccinia graminis f. sp. tritici TaxID=56615 RepID=A0A5B0NST0_PUCGR|nr:hypothetical protein PGT21_024965 [Puccinia graminis f. sp. tritici]KAA1092271.1 hypothetical protein PGTUg99_011263 [Puccinia graminis f. sp. tritici]